MSSLLVSASLIILWQQRNLIVSGLSVLVITPLICSGVSLKYKYVFVVAACALVIFYDSSWTSYLSLAASFLLGWGLLQYKQLASQGTRNPKLQMIFYTSLTIVLIVPTIMFP